jgi:hypothetical protein
MHIFFYISCRCEFFGFIYQRDNSVAYLLDPFKAVGAWQSIVNG